MRAAALLCAALIAGCSSRTASPPSAATAEPGPPPFTRLPGSPASTRVGFVEPVRDGASHCVVVLAPGVAPKTGELLVSRDRTLRATALLEVEQTLGRSALARIRRGRPGPKDEAVRPAGELRQLAETLAPVPGT
ncbi:MAG: hypothetical protein ACKO4N_06350 [Verrucomicrobiota bacterium]